MRTRIVPALGLVILLAVSVRNGVLAAGAEVKLAVVPDGPVVDGRLDDPCWAEAFRADEFHVFREPEQTRGDTSVKILADSAWLYVGIRCEHPAPREMRANVVRNNTGEVFGDECVKLFLAPGATGDGYFRYVLNTANAHDFSRTFRDPAGWAADAPWPSAARITDEGWEAEVAIPLAYLAAYGDISTFRMSVFRRKVVPKIEAEVVVGESDTIACWPAHHRDWIEPERMALLVGLDPDRIATPFLAAVSDASVTRYRATEDSLFYRTRIVVRPLTPRDGEVAVVVVDRPEVGPPREVTRRVACAGPEEVALTVDVPVENAGPRNVDVVLRGAETGALLGRFSIADTTPLRMMTAYADRSYYTTEPAARILCELGLPDEDLRDYALTATIAGRELGRAESPASRQTLVVDLEGLAPGAHEATIGLRERTGRVLAAQPVEIVKLAPKPGFEVKVDRERGVLLRDGEPFFPLGFFWGAPPRPLEAIGFNAVSVDGQFGLNAPADTSPLLEEAARHGIDLILRTDVWRPSIDNMKILERHFPKDDIPGIWGDSRSLLMRKFWIRGKALSHLTRQQRNELYDACFEAVRPEIVESIRIAREHRNVLAYMNIDEPGNADLRHFDIFHVCRRIHDLAKELDPYRPVLTLYTYHIPDTREAMEVADVVATDPYWNPGTETRGINHVSRTVALQKRRVDAARKVPLAVPLASWWSMTHKRALTHEEIVCQSYLALIHGAKGLIFWRFPVVAHQRQWDAYERLGRREIPALAPAVLAPEVRQVVSYEPGEFAPVDYRSSTEVFPDVQARLFREPDGGYILLAANSRNYPVRARFAVSGMSGLARGLFTGAAFVVEDESFAEDLEPMATRAYRLNRTGASDAPVSVHVTMQADKSAYRPEREVSRRGRPGKRNVVINPSFEEATLPFWPDYYRTHRQDPAIGHPDSPWTLVEDNPFHGRYCLRIKGRRGFRFDLSPLEKAPAEYVFSIYMRTDGSAAHVSFEICGTRKVVRFADSSWSRYSFPVTIAADAPERLECRITPLADDVTVWMDALQLERGTEPTEFQP